MPIPRPNSFYAFTLTQRVLSKVCSMGIASPFSMVTIPFASTMGKEKDQLSGLTYSPMGFGTEERGNRETSRY